jgi:hypothetical protein
LRDKAGQEMLLNVTGAVDEDGTLKEGIAGLHSEIAKFNNEDFKVKVPIDDEEFK